MVVDKRESEVSTRYLVLLSKCFTSSVQYLVLYLVQLLLTSTGRYRASISLSGTGTKGPYLTPAPSKYQHRYIMYYHVLLC